MKKFLQNLLILFCFALCGLIAFQWVRETRLREEIRGLHETVYKKSELIQNIEGLLKQSQAEVVRLDGVKTELTETVKTNRQELAEWRKTSDRLEKEIEAHKRQLELYKDATDRANESIKEQNRIIKDQNARLKEMADSRNEVAEKYNEVVKQHNDVVNKYNDLVKMIEKERADAAAAQAEKKK